MKRLYDWVVSWAYSPYGSWALFILAFTESSFFPIPPDVLLIALAVGRPKASLRFALICSAGSVMGACLGYLIGWQFMTTLGERIVDLYGLQDKIDYIGTLYNRYDAWAVGIAGFTPIPYKVFTITAGMFRINFAVFVVASIVSRSARFFLIGGLIYLFGSRIQAFIERYFNLIAILFCVLLLGGFILLKLLF